MRYVVRGRLREGSELSPRRYFELAVREWAVVVGWIRSGTAVAYGRHGGSGGAIVLSAASEAEARRLAQILPFTPYAEIQVTPADAPGPAERQPLVASPGGSAAHSSMRLPSGSRK
jgi:hypothetical protein